MIPRNKNIIIICFLTAILLLTLSGCSFRKKQEVNPSTIVEQAAADAGLPNVTELVESLNGKPALVFYNFQHDKARLLKALEKTTYKVRELKTEQDQDDWNAGKIQVGLRARHAGWFGKVSVRRFVL